MPTLYERIRAAWDTGDLAAIDREVEACAAEGMSSQAVENVLEVLLLEVRAAGADDDQEEIIACVWDRVAGWCRPERRIAFAEPDA